MRTNDAITAIKSNELDFLFESMYGAEKVDLQRTRYIEAVERFVELYGEADISLFSVPGRSEISGNHTDHNKGRVIAASIDLDIIAVASKRSDEIISVTSKGFDPDTVGIDSLIPRKEEHGNSSALIAGVCDGFLKEGFKIGGYNAYTTSNVLKGSGLSSSAAFEVMIGNILNHFYNDSKIENSRIAMISRYAENVFFGKPCGLMDQMACAVGGFITIDFASDEDPKLEKLDFDLDAHGYTLCIVNTGGNHTDLTDDYAAIPKEMKKVATCFGRSVLGDITASEIINRLPELRRINGDRAVLRALHFVDENLRVDEQVEALKNDDIDSFLRLVIDSGNSSCDLLQNAYSPKDVEEQGITLALELSRRFLKDKKAAWRVHGGGFAGTIQAFVPNEAVADYKEFIEGIFGNGSCHQLRVRQTGAMML